MTLHHEIWHSFSSIQFIGKKTLQMQKPFHRLINHSIMVVGIVLPTWIILSMNLQCACHRRPLHLYRRRIRRPNPFEIHTADTEDSPSKCIYCIEILITITAPSVAS